LCGCLSALHGAYLMFHGQISSKFTSDISYIVSLIWKGFTVIA